MMSETILVRVVRQHLLKQIVLLLLFFGIPKLDAQITSQHTAVYLEWGTWQPHSINSEPALLNFGANGSTPHVNTGVLIKITEEVGIGLSAGFWAVRDLEKKEDVHSLVIHPVSFTLKHWIIPGNRFSAFAVYSAGIYWGIENETVPLGAKLKQARACIGFSLGAGFDVAITKRFGLGLSVNYKYVRYNQSIGGIDDFSGPSVSIIGYYYL